MVSVIPPGLSFLAMSPGLCRRGYAYKARSDITSKGIGGIFACSATSILRASRFRYVCTCVPGPPGGGVRPGVRASPVGSPYRAPKKYLCSFIWIFLQIPNFLPNLQFPRSFSRFPPEFSIFFPIPMLFSDSIRFFFPDPVRY